MDYYHYLLRGACGLSLPTMESRSLHPSLVFTPYSKQTGKVVSVQHPRWKEIIDCCIYPQKGDEIHAFRTAYDRIGHLVLHGESIQQLLDLYQSEVQHFPFVTLQTEE